MYRKGFALIAAIIIMVILAGLGLFAARMLSTDADISLNTLNSTQAFYIAEAGVEHVIYKLKNDSAYRSSGYSTPESGSLGEGSFSVAVSKSGNTYTLTSVGSVGAIERTVEQSVVISQGAFPAAFDYAVFGNTNNNQLRLKDNVAISGDFYYDGDVKVDEDASVNDGLVYADAVTGDGTYTAAGSPPDPLPTYPVFDTTTYDSAITTAEAEASGNWTLSGSNTYNLNGGTVYYEEVTIKDNAVITGTGTIVATKDVTIKNNANISSNVTIISKKEIKFKDDAVMQSGAIVYSKDKVKLEDSANVTGSLIVSTSNKTVEMKDDSVLTGIIYADKAKLGDDAVITGSVVANEFDGNKIEDNVRITYDQSSLPGSAPAGLETGSATVTPQADWKETS